MDRVGGARLESGGVVNAPLLWRIVMRHTGSSCRRGHATKSGPDPHFPHRPSLSAAQAPGGAEARSAGLCLRLTTRAPTMAPRSRKGPGVREASAKGAALGAARPPARAMDRVAAGARQGAAGAPWRHGAAKEEVPAAAASAACSRRTSCTPLRMARGTSGGSAPPGPS